MFTPIRTPAPSAFSTTVFLDSAHIWIITHSSKCIGEQREWKPEETLRNWNWLRFFVGQVQWQHVEELHWFMGIEFLDEQGQIGGEWELELRKMVSERERITRSTLSELGGTEIWCKVVCLHFSILRYSFIKISPKDLLEIRRLQGLWSFTRKCEPTPLREFKSYSNAPKSTWKSVWNQLPGLNTYVRWNLDLLSKF